MPILDHFGLLAPFYDRAIKPAFPQKLITLLDLPADGLVLDAGGGTGRIAQFLTGKIQSIVIADSSLEMLQQAAQKNCCSLVCSNTESLPFPDELFTRILMVDALHHVINQICSRLDHNHARIVTVIPPGIKRSPRPEQKTTLINFECS